MLLLPILGDLLQSASEAAWLLSSSEWRAGEGSNRCTNDPGAHVVRGEIAHRAKEEANCQDGTHKSTQHLKRISHFHLSNRELIPVNFSAQSIAVLSRIEDVSHRTWSLNADNFVK